jgi:hypothetical protein
MKEIIHSISFRNDKMFLEVTSNGCTQADSFRLDVAHGINYDTLTVVRIRKDECKMMPHIIELEFPIPLDSTKFKIDTTVDLSPDTNS